ncbi:MAG: hypothetical protein Q4C95_03325 [Planctomycetia bacterium]|nr:hypothetical protein [Planctomycetia bacterium]
MRKFITKLFSYEMEIGLLTATIIPVARQGRKLAFWLGCGQ